MKTAPLPKTAIRSRRSRLSLIQKIGVGYAAMALFTATALVYATINLHAIDKAARKIANNELPAIGALVNLRNALLAQESFAGKYAILKDPAFIDLFRQRERESLAILAMLEKEESAEELSPLKRLYAQYRGAAQQLFTGKAAGAFQLRSVAVKLLAVVDDRYLQRQVMLRDVLERADRQRQAAIRWTVAISCTGFLLAVGAALLVSKSVFCAIGKLQRATHRIAAGEWDYDPQIEAGDEIGALADDFVRMAARLKELEQLNLDASPLTRLPGNAAIERVLGERLQGGAQFAFCYADLDNFKPFSDNYGYAKGSDLLRATGDLIAAVVKSCGGADGFVGHVGGDDFVMVVSADRAETVCEAVIEGFDAEVVGHFAPGDLAAGGIEGYDRYGVQRFFPVTTISIAAIICGGGEYASAVEIARAAAQVKDAAKEMPGSSYRIGRQRQTACEN